jgi:hypothetical protein
MQNTFGRRIRRSNCRVLLTGLALGLLAALGVALCARYLYNVLLGPFPIDRQNLLVLADPDSRHECFVTIEGEQVELLFPRSYTGGEEPYSWYALLQVGEKWLVLRLPAGHQGRRVMGTLENLSAFEEEHVLAPRRRGPAGGRDFLPYRLDAVRPFRAVGWLLAVLPLGALAAVSLGLMIAAARRLRDPARHPIARALARFGTPAEVADTIDAELSHAACRAGVFVTPNWLVCFTGGTTVLRRQDLVEVSRLVLDGDRVLHGFRLVDRHGVRLQQLGPAYEVDALVNELMAGRHSVLEHQVLPVPRLAGAEAPAGLAGEQVVACGTDAHDRVPACCGRLVGEPAGPVQDEAGQQQRTQGHEDPAAESHGQLLVRTSSASS